MHSEIMNDRLKGFPSHDHVDKSAVMIMTMIMIVTVIMMKTQANETGDDDIGSEIMNDRLKGFPSRATPDIGLLSKTQRGLQMASSHYSLDWEL